MSKDIQTIDSGQQGGALQLHNPADIATFAKTLKDFISANGLSQKIEKTEYVLVDGWKFAGLNFGLVPIPEEPISLGEGTITVFYEEKTGSWGPYFKVLHGTAIPAEIEKWKKDPRVKQTKVLPLYKYKCNVKLINVATGATMGAGFAICSNEETKKMTFDEYAVASMAQTRAIGKAYRNLLGFLMQAAGFATTPAEEMEDKYAKAPAETAVDLDKDILSQIEKFTSHEKLGEWAACEMTDWHNNPQFTEAVNKRFKVLRNTEKS